MKSIYAIMDSGAVALYNIHVKKKTIGGMGQILRYRRGEDYSFYKTEEFLSFRDRYIDYVLKNHKRLTGYLNLDVINNAEESYKSLKYMESKGCAPLPVFHFGEDPKWLKRYVNEGYKYICIGGISPNRFEAVVEALDRIWSDILTDKNGIPIVKVHGLAVTSFRLMQRYPWFSVDSVSWRKAAAFGRLYIPHYRKDKGFTFDKHHYCIGASAKSPTRRIKNQHILTCTKAELDIIKLWLNHINIPLGSVDKENNMKEWGVLSHVDARSIANMWYYYHLSKSLPKWPWSFRIEKEGFKII